MFGTEDIITHVFPDYFLDYREKSDLRRWNDRVVSNLGEWSGNIFDFFFKIASKLTSDIKVPFQLRNNLERIDDTPVHFALREALANALIHADYYGRQGIVIEKEAQRIVIANPGILRPGRKEALDGISDPRNPTIFKMFSLIDIGERAGSGLFNIQTVWKNAGWMEPLLEERFSPERTVLYLYTEPLRENDMVSDSGADFVYGRHKPYQSSDKLDETSDNLVYSSDKSINSSDKLGKTSDKSSVSSDKSDMTSDNLVYSSDKLEKSSDKIDYSSDKYSVSSDKLINKKELQEFIINYLKQHGQVRNIDIVASTQFSQAWIRRVLNEMAAAKLLKPHGANKNRYYTI
jgi:predicted HTH transcriptional regulator